MLITAAVTNGRGQDWRIEELELETPREDEVLVRIEAVGFCHTDIGFRDLYPGLDFPIVLGHEGAGVVEQVGSGVVDVQPGDHVLISFLSCGHCARCNESQPAYCTHFIDLNFAAKRPDGSRALTRGPEIVSSHFFGQSSFATHALANQRNVVKVPKDVPFPVLAPLGCGVQTGVGAILRSLDCRPGEAVLIVGGGSVGLSAVMGANARECSPIIVVEPVEARRALATRLGATHTIDPTAGDVASAVRAIVADGVRHAFDTSGRPEMLEACLGALGTRGQLGVVTYVSMDQKLPGILTSVVNSGHTIKGILVGDSDPQVFVAEMLDMYKAGKLPVEELISTFSLEDINEAIAAQHRGECVKAVMIPNRASK